MTRTFLLPDEGFSEALHHTVLPYLNERRHELKVTGADGRRISARYYLQPGAQKVICISHGFCEFADRYSEIIYYFLQSGYSVAICEHRGHGFSHREPENHCKVHISTYDTYVSDYHRFVQAVQKVFPGLPLMLFAHSMGGCIGTLYLEKHPETFCRAVLSSPMLDVNSDGIPKPLGLAYGRLMGAVGKGMSCLGGKEPVFGDDEKFEDSCCTEPNRWRTWINMRLAEPHYQTCAGTIAWMAASLTAAPRAVKNGSKVQVPVLVCQAGRDHLVLPAGQEQFVKNCPTAALVRFPKAKHETFNCEREVRTEFWNTVLDFFAEA